MRLLKNTSKTARAAIMLLVLCIISTAMLGGTFAKYTSEYAGADTALVAKWDVAVKEGTTEFAISPAAAADLDLFSHTYVTNINEKDGNDYIIAPGVQGEFVLNVANTGDVAAEITFELVKSGTAGDVPIEYSLSNGSGATYYDLAGLQTALNALPTMQTVAETTGAATQTVYWRWPYEASNAVYGDSTNAADTALGVASAGAASRSTYILTITATATQITPE